MPGRRWPVLRVADAIQVKEAFQNYVPPFDVSATVHELLGTVPDKYLRGLDCVVLMNLGGMSRRDRVGRVWSRKRKVDKSQILARYRPASRNSLPYIELRVDRIVDATEGWALRIPFFREIALGSVLFHEIGHHIHYTMRPEHNEKENVADNWAGKLNMNFMRKKYWYVWPVLKPALKIYGLLRGQHWT